MFTHKNKLMPFLMWLCPLSFFTFQFILRLWPGLMITQIMDQFSISASSFGLLAAFYYYGYSFMQIPVAILLDRYGARYIIFVFAVICGLAMIIFTYTNNFYLAILSRFLVGAGSAVGFLGVSKVVSENFNKNNYAKMIGFSFTIGLLGAIYGGTPISLLIERYNWQNVALTLGIISILIGISSYLFLKFSFNIREEQKKEEIFKIKNFLPLISSPIIWMLAIANLLMVGSLEGFADVWGVPYLMLAYKISKGEAAGLISLIFFGMLFGGPLLAFCSKKFGDYPIIIGSAMGMAIAFMLILYFDNYNKLGLMSLLFTIGIMCCYQVIIFSAGSKLVKPEHVGVMVAFLNCINMLGGSFFHTLIGKILDFSNNGAKAENIRQYDVITFKYALLIIPLSALLGACIIYLINRKLSKEGNYSVNL